MRALFGFVLVSMLLLTRLAAGQAPGECTGGMCGTPSELGGGCGCGCGALLIANVDLGDTYQYADDRDGDGIEDDFDNCPRIENRDQVDGDGDAVGDICDNCPETANDMQEDRDDDGTGDACDPDQDGDDLLDEADNCPGIFNPGQGDVDGDEAGDYCDDDIDGDDVLNLEDNCPFIANPAQLPDEVVPDCDRDTDGDGVSDITDLCLLTPDPDQLDSDDDGMGDACDRDRDDDGLKNDDDNCDTVVNVDQTDWDNDGEGDVCDEHFCYVVDGSVPCLDILTPFAVSAGPDRTAVVGDPLPLTVWANRKNRGIAYTWTIEEHPPGAPEVENPTSWVTLSTPYEYRYGKGRRVSFTPDRPGEYIVKLSARLVFPDDLFPEERVAEHSFCLTAGDAPGDGGCSTAPGGAGVATWLAGLAFFVRRRGSPVARDP